MSNPGIVTNYLPVYWNIYNTLPTPSMTRKAQDFLQEIGVNLLDHFVITDKEFYSMKDHRLF